MTSLKLLLLLCICANTGQVLSLVQAASANDCPNGWTKYERTQSCFKAINERVTFTSAEEACKNAGGRLASIIDEEENEFVFDLARRANLSAQTVWLAKIVFYRGSTEYEWSDGTAGRSFDGFRGEMPISENFCLTMLLDVERSESSWMDWSCSYSGGFSAMCRRPLRGGSVAASSSGTSGRSVPTETGSRTTANQNKHQARRCCIGQTSQCRRACPAGERCIPDDLNCWTKRCGRNNKGWCLPVHDT